MTEEQLKAIKKTAKEKYPLLEVLSEFHAACNAFRGDIINAYVSGAVEWNKELDAGNKRLKEEIERLNKIIERKDVLIYALRNLLEGYDE